jgi:hypothetical protein
MANMPPLDQTIRIAAAAMSAWLIGLPAWDRHPVNASGSVAAHRGPTILSEHDCVMHFARFLAAAGLAWEDLHMELGPGQWMYNAQPGAPNPKRIDLAVIPRQQLAGAHLPVDAGQFPLEAVFEFAHASNYWQHGSGSRGTIINKIDVDIAKTGDYLRSGLAQRGYVVVVEECDHGFPDDYAERARADRGVELLVLRAWS